jgi:hypothetical protein
MKTANHGRDIKNSDGIDLIHAMYLPHADLWRGDRAFSTLLINNRGDFYSRIVPSLAELPGRIEAVIRVAADCVTGRRRASRDGAIGER